MFAVFYDCCACDAWLTREIIGEGGCDFAATVQIIVSHLKADADTFAFANVSRTEAI